MIGEVDQCLFVSGGTVVDAEFVVVSERVGHFHIYIAGESFFSVGRQIMEDDVRIVMCHNVPYTFMESGGSSVERIRTIVDGQRIFFSVKNKLSVGNAVAVSSDGRAEAIYRTVDQMFQGVMPLDDVCKTTFLVRGKQRQDGGSVVGDSHFHASLIAEDVKVGVFPVDGGLEIFALQARTIY